VEENQKFNFQGRAGKLDPRFRRETLPMQKLSAIAGKDGAMQMFHSIIEHTIGVLRSKDAEACILAVNISIMIKAESLGIPLIDYDVNQEAMKLVFVGDRDLTCDARVIQGALSPNPPPEVFILIDAVDEMFLLGGSDETKSNFFEKGAIEEVDTDQILRDAAKMAKRRKVEENKSDQEIMENIDLNKELGLDDKGICLN